MNQPEKLLGISEAASEKRRPRGRPREICDVLLQTVRTVYPELTTHRGRQDKTYFLKALRVLGEEAEYSWLLSPSTGELRSSLLSEIGRCGDDDSIKRVAAEICRRKPKTKEGIALIRRWRTGRGLDASSTDLATKLIKQVSAYLDSHDGLTKPMIEEALELVSGAFRELTEPDTSGDTA